MADLGVFSSLPDAGAPTGLGVFDALPDVGQKAKGNLEEEFLKAVAGGAVTATGSAMTGTAAQQELAKEDRKRSMLGLVNLFNQVDAGTFKEGSISDPDQLDIVETYKTLNPDQKAEWKKAYATAAGYQPPAEDISKTPLFQAGKAVEQYGQETFKPAKDYENSWTTFLGNALGSSAPFAAASILGGPAAGMQAGVAMSAGQTIEDAIQHGASKEDIYKAVNASFLPGITEQLPMELLYAKVPFNKLGKFVGGLFRVGSQVLAEGGQEGFQQWMQNMIAKFTYDPKRDPMDQVWENAAGGGFVGALFGGAAVPFHAGEAPAPPPPGAPPGATPAETIIPPEQGPPGPPPAAPGEPVTTPTEAPAAPPGAPPPVTAPAAAQPTVAAAPAATPEQIAAAQALPQQISEALQVPDSPRLTLEDRMSPIPNDIIDAGKKAVEEATGKPSTFTTTLDVNGQKQVATGNVADLVAADRARTTAMISQITGGVSVPQISPETGPAAPPAAAAEGAAMVVPTEAAPAVQPSIAAPLRERSSEDRMREFRARAAAYDAEVQKLIPEEGKSIRLVADFNPDHKALIGPDMAEPGKYRVTYMDQHGPSGHTVHNTIEDAAREVAGSYHQVGQIGKNVVRQDTAFTAGGRDIPVTYAVVEARDLVTSQKDEGGANPAYPQELQPRDRSRGTSDQQINSIAQNLNPALLDNNASASDGAPIVSADGVVESGNGRVLAIRRAYNENLPSAENYRAYLKSQGYPLGGMKNPVLVRVRQGQMEPGERAAFTREANERTTLAMSATERAMADAAAMKPDVVALYRGGDIAEAGNRDFVRGFMQSVVNPNEQAAMVTPDGTLSQEAIRRVQGALLAKAYGDADLVGALLESPDNNIKAIGGALMDVAGQWAKMREDAAAGTISPEVDITPRVLEAVRLVQRARNEGRPLSEYVAQKDIFSGSTIHQDAEAVLRLMFRNTAGWTMPAGREKLADALRFYTEEAGKTSAGTDLLGEKAATPVEILGVAKKRQYGEEATQEKLALGGRAAGEGAGAPSEKRAVEAQPRPQAEGRAGVPAEARPAPAAAAAPQITEAMREQIRREGEARAKAKAEKEAKPPPRPLPKPKFSVRPTSIMTPELRAQLAQYLKIPRLIEAIAKMKAIPRTFVPGRDDPVSYISKRTYVDGDGDVFDPKWKTFKGVEIIPRLIERARELAAKELKIPTYETAKQRLAVIVIGPPAAGKSTIANKMALRRKAAIPDVDDAKQVIPEYYAKEDGKGGIGADAVHEESSVLGEAAMDELIKAGDNLIIPKIGHKLASIEKLRQRLEEAGYKVELSVLDVDPQSALKRMIKRWERTGRLIEPNYFLDVVAEPPATYIEAKQQGKFDAYSRTESGDGIPTRVTETIGPASVLSAGEEFNRGAAPGESGRGPATSGPEPAATAEPTAKAKVGTAKGVTPGVTSEVRQTQGGQIHYALSDKFRAAADKVHTDLRAALDRLGLTGVNLKVWQQIFADMEHGAFGVDGLYMRNLIDVALNAKDKLTVLHHEAVHAMINMGLFTPTELAILQRTSAKKWVTDAIKANYPEAHWNEEGIAFAFQDWENGARMDGVIVRAFKKMKLLMKGIAQTLTGNDFRTADDIFHQMMTGEIGRRSQGKPALRTGATAKAAATETVMTETGPREQYVIPGAEKATDKQMAGLRAKAPLRSTKAQKDVGGLPLFGDEKNQLSLFSVPAGEVRATDNASPTAPRFKLKRPPTTQQQTQQVSQGFLSRGQAVDRAMRVPFNLLGGLDSQGRWSPGKRLTDKMGPGGMQGFGIGGVLGAGIGTAIGGPVGGAIGGITGGTVGAYILGASPKPTGKFSWFGAMAENAKRGLIDGYGLDPAYVEAYRRSDLGKAAIQREAQGILKVLSNAGVGTNEAKVLQAILTGENINDADMQRLAVPVRQAIDDLGAEAVSLGLISPESYDRNRGAYLHRVYVKHEADVNTLSGWISNRMAVRRKKIIGDELKGRGMFWEVPHDRLMRDVESFQKGTRGAAVQGEKFHVLDEVSLTKDIVTGEEKEKTLRRVYLPANEAIPAKYQGPNWVNRGQWEARKAGKTTTLWRDYTKAERDKMGELVDARYTIAKTFMLMANDLSTGRFFKEVSEKAEWTQSKPPAAPWKDASEYNRYWNDPEVQWVKVPDTNISQTGGKKRWGALAGKFVRAEIWRDLNEVAIAQQPSAWRTLLTQWKQNKTARSPVVHMNNVMSNVMFMDLADVRTQDFVKGMTSYLKGDASYQEALMNGAFGSDVVSAEIRKEVLQPILEEITKQATGAKNPFLAKAGMMGVFADKLWTGIKKFDNSMLQAYQMEDEVFRMATYMRRRSQGESAEVAAKNARDQFLNYDIRAPWVVAMRNSLLPFISYTYRAVPKLAENIMHRPWKLAKYMAIAYAVNALSYLWDEGDDKDEKRQRAALRNEEQGYTWLGMPRMIRMPWRDQNGLPVFLDVRRWIPAGDIFDVQQGNSAIPIPAPLHFGGPLQMAFELMLNRQAFNGQDITNQLTDDAGDKFSGVADWAWKSWAPGSFWTPYSWYWTRIGNALYGATDAAGHPYSPAQAVLSSLGVKVKPLDVNDGIKWHFNDYKKTENALKQQLRSAARQLDRGLISQSAFNAQAADIMEKFGRVGQQVKQFGQDIRRPPAEEGYGARP